MPVPRQLPMLKLIQNLISLNSVLIAKARSVIVYDEALALYEAEDYEGAFTLMKEAADLGSTQAMSILGSMFLLGRGVAENGKEAEAWLKRASEQGFDEATSILGMAYATGKAGIKPNITLAREMLKRVATTDENAARMLEMIDKRQGMFRKLK